MARAGRNDVLESFWAAISLLASGAQHGISDSFGNRLHVVEAHEEILRACRAREPGVAAARMAAHVGELEHLVRPPVNSTSRNFAPLICLRARDRNGGKVTPGHGP